ncbi:ribosome-binding protein 1 [Babesia caballi]|uniref:Ribosome-binding protein 1 n=1 Tax=Babesia caballi TaxID=5871 RepID=A0AAV4LRE7_BABCB|nr:ribosome-binding protein 1 [Babesia caballi]
MTSGSETGSCEGRQIEEPKTLKDALDFLAALNGNITLVGLIAAKLEQKAITYFNADALTSGTYDIKECLTEVLGAASTTRSRIVSVTKLPDYECYTSLRADQDCVDECVGFILNLLPILHDTLYYLYFRAGTALSRHVGADWAMYNCNEETDDLFKWLTHKSIHSRSSATESKEMLLPGGYSDKSELSNAIGNKVGEEVSTIVDSEGSVGRLPNLIFAISLNISFSRASTAAALSFIDAFCKAVTSGDFYDDNEYVKLSSQLTPICAALPVNLKFFTTGLNGRRLIESLFQGNEREYEDILRRDAYGIYVGWLKDKLPTLISSLDEMRKECEKWDPSSIYPNEVVGPFAYGFMFGNPWRRNGTNMYQYRSRVKTFATKLIGECESPKNGTIVALWKCLNSTYTSCPLPSSTSESPTVNHNSETPSITVPITTEEKQVEVLSESQGQSSPSPPTLTAEPVASAYSISSGPEPSGASSVPAQSNEQTSSTSDTSGHSSDPHDSGHSGTTTSLHSCPPADACSEIHEGGSTGVVNTSSPESHHADDVTNAQSTITIGGATGGVAVLGGGCAALYFLNVGGIKTLITGVL